jgi:peptidyl-prolyl cis-trans isomerase D
MLDGLRRLGRTWAGKILGVFLLIGLAGFGISNVLLDFGSQTVARVGGEDISIQEFSRAYNDDLNRWAQQLGQVPTPEMATALGIPTQTLLRLASDTAVAQLTDRMGLGVSDQQLGRVVRADPAFSNILGQFDRQAFAEVLRRTGMTEAEYFDLARSRAHRQQLESGLFGDAFASDAAGELLARYTGDQRTIDYFVLSDANIPPVAEPTEEELRAYLAEHQQEFRTEEERTVDLLVLSLDTLAATIDITEEQIAAEYERTRDQRQRIERRAILQAPLTPEQVTAFEQGKAAGETFDQLIAETGVEVTELGTLTRAQITDAALGDAAFGLAEDDFIIISGVGGQRAVSVSDIEPGAQITLDEAREEIRADLAEDEARASYIDIQDQVEELRAAFQPLSQIAERFGVPLHQVTLTASGEELSAVGSIAEENRPRVATAVFRAEQGALAPTIAISANNNIWFDLEAIEPARDQTLEEVRDAVAAAVTNERTAAALAAEVEDVLSRLEAGAAFADVAASLNHFPVLSQPMTRSGDGTSVLNQAVASAVFNGAEGHFGSAVNGEGDPVIFQVVEVIPGTAATPEVLNFLADGTRQSLYAGFVGGVREDAGITINRQVFDQLVSGGAVQ